MEGVKKITEKRFSVMQLTENREEYVVLEMFYILGFMFSYVLHYNENKVFKSVFLAIKEKDRLKQEENRNQIKRDLIIVLTLVGILSIPFILR